MKKYFYCFYIFLFISFQIFPQDTIRVKLSDLSAPYTDMDGNLGLNKILLNKIISPSKYKISIIESDSTDLPDLIGLSENNTLSDTNYEFSIPVFNSSYIIVSNTDIKVKNIDEIVDNKIGVIENSLAENKMKGKLFFYTKYKNCNSAFFALFNKDVNYLIVEKPFAKYFLNQELLKNKLFIVNDDLFPTEIGFYVLKKDKGLISQINSSVAKFKKSEDYQSLLNKYFIFPTDYTFLWIIIISFLVLSAITFLVLFIRKRNIGDKLLGYYRLSLKGLIIFRVSPTYTSNENNEGSKFKDALNELQLKYQHLNFAYDYSGNSVKINLTTPKKIFLSDKEYLNNLTDSLNNTLKELPPNKYLIDINISGEYSNFKSHNSFLIVNKGNEVGLHIDQNKKSFIPNL